MLKLRGSTVQDNEPGHTQARSASEGHTSPKRQRGSDCVPRWRFGLVSLFLLRAGAIATGLPGDRTLEGEEEDEIADRTEGQRQQHTDPNRDALHLGQPEAGAEQPAAQGAWQYPAEGNDRDAQRQERHRVQIQRQLVLLRVEDVALAVEILRQVGGESSLIPAQLEDRHLDPAAFDEQRQAVALE